MNTRKKLPAGFGSVRYLGPGRQNPYAVHPSARDGVRQSAICYVSSWHVGVAVLFAWNAGQYVPGMERQLCREAEESFMDRAELDDFCARLVRYAESCAGGRGAGPCPTPAPPDPEPEAGAYRGDDTIGGVYRRFYAAKFGSAAARRLSPATAANARSVFRKLAPIRDRRMDELTIDELQDLVNGLGLGRTMVEKTVVMLRQLYRFALSRELCRRNPAQYLLMPDTPPHVHHLDFTDEELAVLWRHRGEPAVRMVLIMCYTGFRISAYETMETDLDSGFMRGGVKTDAGRDRIVPVHHAVLPLVRAALEEDGGYLCGMKKARFSSHMSRRLTELGIDGGDRRHTPHSCRHTFSRLCESGGVREADRKRLMGHSFGGDITNAVYGHRSLEELRGEIEKLWVPEEVESKKP